MSILTGTFPIKKSGSLFKVSQSGLPGLRGVSGQDIAIFSNRFAACKRLDGLDEAQQAAYVQRFREETGFPDLAETSRRIHTNLTEALVQTEQARGLKVLLATYDPYCSVALGTALPGSDVDSLFVLLLNSHPTAFGNRENIRGLETGYIRALTMGFKQTLLAKVSPALLSKDFDGLQIDILSEDELYDTYRSVLARTLGTKLNTETLVLNRLRPDVIHFFRTTGNRPDESSYSLKIKHQLRQNMMRKFPELETAEQYLLVKIVQLGVRKGTAKHNLMADKPGNPFHSILQRLEAAGLVTKLSNRPSHFLAPWMPNHSEEAVLEMDLAQSASLRHHLGLKAYKIIKFKNQ